jgi:hypothetical protein
MKGRGLTPACVQSQKRKEVKEVFILSFFYFLYFFDFAVNPHSGSIRLCGKKITGQVSTDGAGVSRHFPVSSV